MLNVDKELAALERMTTRELQTRFVEVFGEPCRSHHKRWLVKRIIWRLQANAEGDLSERARRRALELANDADLRLTAPRDDAPPKAPLPLAQRSDRPVERPQDNRLPMPGAQIVRDYKGRRIVVTVLDNGFEFEGERYRSLSAVAQAVTGSKWNGYLFFGLVRQGGAA